MTYFMVSYIHLQELFSYGELDLLILKAVLDTKKDEIKKIYSMIYYTWPELIRLFFISKMFIKDYNTDLEKSTILDKLFNVHDVLAYNTFLNFEEKLSILEKLVIISYETDFIRSNIKMGQDQKSKFRKKKKELDEELKDIP